MLYTYWMPDATIDDPHDCLTRCMLCDDNFNLLIRLGLDTFFAHIFSVHHCIIDDVDRIINFRAYITYWRTLFQNIPIEEIFPAVQIDDSGVKYFLFSPLAKQDKLIRHQLTLDYVMKVHTFEQRDPNFARECLICKYFHRGTRPEYVNHLANHHNLHFGNPQKLVFFEQLINHIDHKLQSFSCIFCDKTFINRNVFKVHMRRRIHKRINPNNPVYDRYYLVNYMELGKNWAEAPVDMFIPENDKLIACLLCPHLETSLSTLYVHMNEKHQFNFCNLTKTLGFYQKIKLVNFMRRSLQEGRCLYCDKLDKNEDLEKHMEKHKPLILPKKVVFDKAEFYFPVIENDSFLYLLDGIHDDSD